MLYQVLYALYTIATIVFGGVYLVGPFTIRHVAVFFFLLYMLIHYKGFPKDKTMTAYWLFIFLFGISSISNGFTEGFSKMLIANYLVCYVSFWATSILIEYHRSYHVFVYTFVAIGVISGIFTILQYFNVYWAFVVPDLLRTFTSEEMDQLSTLEGIIANQSLPGIFNRVDNGYYIAAATVLSTILYSKTRKLYTLIVWMFLVLSLYMVQQRAALFIGLSLSLLSLNFNLTKTHKRVVISVVIVGVLYIIGLNTDILSFLNDSRYADMTNTESRQDLWKIAYDYIMYHPFDANLFDFGKRYPDVAAHNLFLNAFLCCGMFGGLLILYILIVFSKRCVDIYKLRKSVKVEYYLAALAFIAFNFISLTHNNSVVNGNIVFWILATPMMTKLYLKN